MTKRRYKYQIEDLGAVCNCANQHTHTIETLLICMADIIKIIDSILED